MPIEFRIAKWRNPRIPKESFHPIEINMVCTHKDELVELLRLILLAKTDNSFNGHFNELANEINSLL